MTAHLEQLPWALTHNWLLTLPESQVAWDRREWLTVGQLGALLQPNGSPDLLSEWFGGPTITKTNLGIRWHPSLHILCTKRVVLLCILAICKWTEDDPLFFLNGTTGKEIISFGVNAIFAYSAFCIIYSKLFAHLYDSLVLVVLSTESCFPPISVAFALSISAGSQYI